MEGEDRRNGSADLITENLVLLGVEAVTEGGGAETDLRPAYGTGLREGDVLQRPLEREAEYPTGLSFRSVTLRFPTCRRNM